MDTEYIDLVSLDGNRSIVFNGLFAVYISANDVLVKGIFSARKIDTAANKSLMRIENCHTLAGGSFNGAAGTFIDCTAGNSSFGFFNGASGTFINCTSTDINGGGSSFAGSSGASGVFINCTAGGGSFGYYGASGTFTNCIAGINSFGYFVGASGTFTNCTAGSNSFGNSSLTGKLYYCRLTSGTFRTVSGAGITRYCIDGDNTANNQG
jgi:hypothetical protein